MFKNTKKQVSVLVVSALVIKASKKDNLMLEKVSCIYYSVWFKKNKVKVLIDFNSKINAMILAYASKLLKFDRHPWPRHTSVSKLGY